MRQKLRLYESERWSDSVMHALFNETLTLNVIIYLAVEHTTSLSVKHFCSIRQKLRGFESERGSDEIMHAWFNEMLTLNGSVLRIKYNYSFMANQPESTDEGKWISQEIRGIYVYLRDMVKKVHLISHLC